MRRVIHNVGILLVLCSGAAIGCGADDEKEPEPKSGTCDWRDSPMFAPTCVEVTGTESEIDAEREHCLEYEGEWSTNPCSAIERIGCCDYREEDREYSECFYPGAGSGAEGTCVGLYEGVWTPN